MSATVLIFTPQAELEPSANVAAFIEFCRKSEVLGARTQFDRNVWEVGYQKGQNKILRAIFSTLEASARDEPEPHLSQPFLDFAKATIVYLHDKRPVASQSIRIAALRCMEAALREGAKGLSPTAVDEIVLDRAVGLARDRVSPGAAYRVAGQLQLIADLMRSKGFITLRQRWNHGIKKPQEVGSRISKDALQVRQKKLPSAATLRALGGIFFQAVEVRDVVVSSNTSLMLCAPERINEVLRLRRSCIVEGDGEFQGKLGLRWSGSKGFQNSTKWLPTEMAPIARQAVANLIQVTGPAQRLAAWYTANPEKLYFHERAVHLRERKVVTLAEVGLLLWDDETADGSANIWAQITNNLPKQSLGGRVGFLLADVERAVLAMLPKTFPYMPGDPELLCQDAMALVRVNEMHATRATYRCMFSCVDHGVITNPFGGRDDRASIFERFGYTEDDGSSIELRSHSLRHYLNMLAQVGGLSSAEIAIFSGRRDVKQNCAYNHMSSLELQAPISEALKLGFTSELELMSNGPRKLSTRGEFRNQNLTAAHSTEYGWCIHDFASEPCQMYRDCINCEEQECIKGEEEKEANLRLLKSETEYLLNQAKAALSEEEYGADNWVKHQSTTLERIKLLLSILEDSTVAHGARIRLDIASAPLITVNDLHPNKPVKKSRARLLT
ncbi:integrase [Achromobacter sp. NPDC008082]|uniref:integrase n=1 Tax=Achromobacter sp. NPDC008082 TaxID=3363888 RepID=UPI0036EA9945